MRFQGFSGISANPDHDVYDPSTTVHISRISRKIQQKDVITHEKIGLKHKITRPSPIKLNWSTLYYNQRNVIITSQERSSLRSMQRQKLNSGFTKYNRKTRVGWNGRVMRTTHRVLRSCRAGAGLGRWGGASSARAARRRRRARTPRGARCGAPACTRAADSPARSPRSASADGRSEGGTRRRYVSVRRQATERATRTTTVA